MDSLHDLTALELSKAIHGKVVSCEEVMRCALQRIHAENGTYNALVQLDSEESLIQQAREHDALWAAGTSKGWLHGIPVAIKDLAHATGFVTTSGSRVQRNFLPPQDSLHVARMKAAGAIVIGKTNTPEFGLGSNTFNAVYGSTGNAWDPSRTSGGSSGGAAVALARRMLWVADGSDFMGSLRNPAAWNHVFGLRPSQGRVPGWPKPDVWISQLGTDGPMARHVRDLARLLDVQAGFDPRVPLSLESEPHSFVPPEALSVKGLRVGWLGDLQGHLATEEGVLSVCESALSTLQQAGAHVESASLGMDPTLLWEAWLVWRQALVASTIGAILAQPGARELTKPEALWEVDRAQTLKFETFMHASATRSDYLHRLLKLFERFDVLALPSAQMWPFSRDLDWPRTIGSRHMDTYHRWMEVTLYATFGGLPALSVPAGFDAQQRWPMGLQLIGPPRGDRQLLQMGAAYEDLIPELMARKPPTAPSSVSGSVNGSFGPTPSPVA